MGCRQVRPQHLLVRTVRDAEGHLRVGRSLAGRGMWLCRDDPACLDQARRRKRLGDDDMLALRAYLGERERMEGRVPQDGP